MYILSLPRGLELGQEQVERAAAAGESLTHAFFLAVRSDRRSQAALSEASMEFDQDVRLFLRQRVLQWLDDVPCDQSFLDEEDELADVETLPDDIQTLYVATWHCFWIGRRFRRLI